MLLVTNQVELASSIYNALDFMTSLYSMLVFLSGVLIGSVVGYIYGFATASHADVMAGVCPRTNNKILIFFARPTATLNWWEGSLFVIVMLAYIPIFFGLFAVPAVIGIKLNIDDPITIKVTYSISVGALLFARRFGTKAWRNLV
jgi:hypothetical protein